MFCNDPSNFVVCKIIFTFLPTLVNVFKGISRTINQKYDFIILSRYDVKFKKKKKIFRSCWQYVRMKQIITENYNIFFTIFSVKLFAVEIEFNLTKELNWKMFFYLTSNLSVVLLFLKAINLSFLLLSKSTSLSQFSV